MSVVNSSVSGHEGGDISVQCFYSSGYQNKVKQWCRYKYQSCYTVERTDTSQNSSVQISDDDDDDGRRSFTVLMTGLRRTDSGWYFCSVGDLQVPVQLTVTGPKISKITNQFSHDEILNAYTFLLKLTYFLSVFKHLQLFQQLQHRTLRQTCRCKKTHQDTFQARTFYLK